MLTKIKFEKNVELIAISEIKSSSTFTLLRGRGFSSLHLLNPSRAVHLV